MKVALVHDWLTGMRGGEKVLEQLCLLFPEAPIYTLFHFPGTVSKTIESHEIHTSFLQKAPLIKNQYRNYLPIFPSAVESFDLQSYDLVISSSHCVAKGIIPSSSGIHLCYCHTPMRYIWSHYWDYFGDHRTGFVKRKTLPMVMSYLRMWDVSSSNRVDEFIANSKFIGERIQKYYGRTSQVVYPPVDIDFFIPSDRTRENFCLIVSALVPYKRLEVAIEAFRNSNRNLVIVGTGPEEKRLKKLAPSNVKFLGRIDANRLRELYQSAGMLIQPGVEDFGINVIEALACACPVLAYRKGGATETVVEGITGIFFNELTAESLRESVDKAGRMLFNVAFMREMALRFSPSRFQKEIEAIVQERLQIKVT
jgi:glycosyltransferase involved in cell wall biosynthesis